MKKQQILMMLQLVKIQQIPSVLQSFTKATSFENTIISEEAISMAGPPDLQSHTYIIFTRVSDVVSPEAIRPHLKVTERVNRRKARIIFIDTTNMEEKKHKEMNKSTKGIKRNLFKGKL